MPKYYTADAITYRCNFGYRQQNEKEITCTCDATNTNNWSCTIEEADFKNECKKGWY